MREIKKRHQIKDGGIITYPFNQTNYFVCCDCGLTHKITLKKRGEEVDVQIWRDEEKTLKEKTRLVKKIGKALASEFLP